MSPYFRALRPHQWVKNLLVFLPLLASHNDTPHAWAMAFVAFVAFCLIASGVYVVNDLLDLSKIESGHLELESVDFSVVDAVEESLAMFAQPAEAKGLELAVQFIPHDAKLWLRGDPFRLRQVSPLVGCHDAQRVPDGESEKRRHG